MKKVKLGYIDTFCTHELNKNEKICAWPGCNHEFDEGEWVTVEQENDREGIYCGHHNYCTPFSEEFEIIDLNKE